MKLVVAALPFLACSTTVAALDAPDDGHASRTSATKPALDPDCARPAYTCMKDAWIAYEPDVAGGPTRRADAAGQDDPQAVPESGSGEERTLPFLGRLAREQGYELPLPLGVGVVYTYLSRDVEVTDVRVGRNGAPPESVSEYADLGTHSEVDNLNLKFDAWLLPFLNVYAIAGYVKNESDTSITLTLPPLLPGGPERSRSVTLPTSLEGPVGGLGVTLAGGYKQFFFAADINAARVDMGFDDRFEAVIKSVRVGWNGKAGNRPLRLWVNATYWDTFFEVRGTVDDPDGGTLRFEVDQGPEEPWTYGVGAQYSALPWLDLATDVGWDLEGGWYFVLVPVARF